MRLYEISDGVAAIEDEILDAVMDGEGVEALKAMLDSLKAEGEEKILDLGRFYKNLRSEVDMIKAEKRRLTEMQEKREAKIEWLKGYLLAGMDSLGKTKITDGVTKVRQQKCPTKTVAEGEIPGKLAGVLAVGDREIEVDLWMNAPNALDSEFLRVDCKVDMAKKRIIDHWKETGEEVYGAKIVDNEKTLVVR
jgi:hypothetical protein